MVTRLTNMATGFHPPPHDPPRIHRTPLPPPMIPDADVTGFAGDNPLLGLHQTVKTSWIGLEEPKALAYPHAASYSEVNKGTTANSIMNAISEHLNGRRPKVTAPTINNTLTGEGDNRRPWCYLVTGLPKRDLASLIKLGFLSNANASVHIIPFDPPPSGYVARITDLTFTATSRPTVENLIKQTISAHETVRNFMKEFIAENNDLIPQPVRESDRALEWIIESVHAYHVLAGGELRPDNNSSHWRWYILTPTSDAAKAKVWTENLLQLEFNAVTDGYGRHATNFKCRGCKSTNHNEGECPFPEKTPHLKKFTTVSRSQGGKKPRGRGGGRGRGGRKGNSSHNHTDT